MLNTFIRLLGHDAVKLHRYIRLALTYSLLCSLTIVLLVPVLHELMQNKTGPAAQWLVAFLLGVSLCWALRRKVEKAGIAVGVAVLQGGRHQLAEHVSSLPLAWFGSRQTARLNHLATQGMMEIAQLPAHVFTPLLSGIVTPLIVVILLFLIQPLLGLACLLSLPLLAGVFWLSSRISRRADQAYHQQAAQSSQRMVEFAQAQSVLRAFNGEEGGSRFLAAAISDQQQAGNKLIRLSALSAVFNLWAVQAVFGGLLLLGLWSLLGDGAVLHDQHGVVDLLLVLLLLYRFVDPLMDLAAYSEVLRGAQGQLAAIAEVLAVEPQSQPLVPGVPGNGSVSLEGVSFRYAAGQPEVLRELSLHIPAGSMTALVGASGSGKTTLIRLISRFFDADSGRVKVGGVDVRELGSEQLAGQISQIFQDAYLFQGSIADNIRVGKPDASDEEVHAAANLAGVSEMVDRLPEGLATQVGEGGARLSGGERQRIAIARALIKDAPILLVDEATAALDTENQATIAAALARLRGKRTLIVIAHQLSTVTMADQIVVLEQGRIAEQGRHAELAANGGLYAHFIARRRAAKGWCITGEADEVAA